MCCQSTTDLSECSCFRTLLLARERCVVDLEAEAGQRCSHDGLGIAGLKERS